ncbi:PLP-dependent transferase [Deltaproteobacteria bacterium TL4]
MFSIPQELLDQCFQHGIETYPEEACGVISGNRADPSHLEQVHPMRNVMDEYHAMNPQQYLRTNRNAYLLNPLEQMKLERSLKKQEKSLKIIYHTHPDVGAYFSEQDQADALWNGAPRFPGVSYLVCGITQGKPEGAVLVHFNPESNSFDLHELPVKKESTLKRLADYITPTISFPENSSEFRHFETVGGKHAVTAQLPRLEDIIDWQEGRCELSSGYYRFVDHPLLYRLQQGLQHYYEVRNCWGYTSFQAALMELLDYLLLSKPEMTLKVITTAGTEEERYVKESLPGLQTTMLQTTADQLKALEPWSQKKDDILVVAMKDPRPFIEGQLSFLQQIKKQRIPVVVCSNHLPSAPLLAEGSTYWVSNISFGSHTIEGGVILSNADRQMAELNERRKRRGTVLSSRNIEFLMNDTPAQETNIALKQVSQQLCTMEKAHQAFLFPSGMNTIATLFSLLRSPKKSQIIAIGHLYTDTYALLTYDRLRIGSSQNVFLDSNEIDQLPDVITEQTAAIITETITNPLNDVPDLEAIAKTAHQYHIPFIVDNTFATPYNCNPLTLGADYVVHSTTKYLNGTNDHAGGAVLVRNAQQAELIQQFQQQWHNQLSPLEAEVLWEHLQDLDERMPKFNQNALKVATFLNAHPAVQKVYFNALPSHSSYEVAQKILRGPGSVVSFVLKENHLEALRRFYNAPLDPILKAPSLGSNQTLLCPYTLLAHYHEEDRLLAELHLSRYLIRIAVGCEETIEPILAGLQRGLEQVSYNSKPEING